ncbi:MAG: hypothetical protein R3E96_05370 [Planctomycetota bacterium]
MWPAQPARGRSRRDGGRPGGGARRQQPALPRSLLRRRRAARRARPLGTRLAPPELAAILELAQARVLCIDPGHTELARRIARARTWAWPIGPMSNNPV